MDARNEETGSTRYAPHVHQSGTRIDGRPLRVAFVAHEGSDGGADLLLYELVCGLEQSALCTTMSWFRATATSRPRYARPGFP